MMTLCKRSTITVIEAIKMYLVIVFSSMTTAVRQSTYLKTFQEIAHSHGMEYKTCLWLLSIEVFYAHLTVQLYYSWFFNFTCGMNSQLLLQ